ncbi:MAG: WD40 repeat domain-containing serine/threonine-protein kinase [Mariniblastus sp.]|nr:WD40 repeat domain-containing serine/threonine-protein kinase [Mariniblastus sp.]
MQSEFSLDDQIDTICDRFETAWKTGEPPGIAEYWEPLPGDTENRLLQELIRLDHDYRCQSGNTISPELYLSICPGAEALIQQVLAACAGDEKTTALGGDPNDTMRGDPLGQEFVLAGAPEAPLKQIGPYELVRKIGAGGMGMVFLAEQREPVRRTVAIKLMRAELDTPELQARFEVEIQALAMMNHPNIARVLDMGKTENGTPYVAIEYIDGFSLTKYCDRRQLSIARRMELFIQLGAAISHAHRKGVLHRDLKPSNILVSEASGKPIVKVIDFGLARAVHPQERLAENTLVTMPGNLLGTLEYMSPEQAEMNEQGLDTRTDVYSLGAILYELLVGSTPLNRDRVGQEGLHRLMIQIVEGEFQKPSERLLAQGERAVEIAACRQTTPQRLAGMLRRELDWICAKALQKKRSQRYEGVAFLLQDIQSYLQGDVVTARPPTATYQLGKAIWKHRMLVAVSTLLLIILVGGWWTTSVNLAESRRQEQKARDAEIFARRMENVARDQAKAARQAEGVALQREAGANENLRIAERNAYAANLLVIQSDWENGRYLNRFNAVLNEYRQRPDLRGFEWDYWNRLSSLRTESVLPHPAEAISMDLSYDGRQLVSLGQDNPIRIWDVESGTELHRIEVPGRLWGRESVQFSPEGGRLLYISGFRALVLDLPSGKISLEIKGNRRPFYAGDFSLDGSKIILASEDLTVDFLDAETGEKRRSEKGAFSSSQAFGYSKELSVAIRDAIEKSEAGEQPLRYWDNQNEAWVSIPPGDVDINTAASGNRFIVSGDRYYMAHRVKGVKQVAPDTAPQWFRFPQRFGPGLMSWAIDRNGKYVAVANIAGMITVWPVDRPAEPLLIRESTGSVEELEFSPDSRRLFALDSSGDVRILDLADKEFPRVIGSPPVSCFQLSSDRSRVVFCGGSSIEIFSPGREVAPRRFDYPGSLVDSLSVTNQGDRVLVSHKDGLVKMLAAESGEEVWSWQRELSGRDPGVFFDGRGEKVLVADGKKIAVLDAEDGSVLHSWKAHRTIITGLAFHPDGKRVASGSYDGTFRFWELGSKEPIWSQSGKSGRSNVLSFSRDGRVLATCFGGVRLLDADTGKTICELDTSARDVAVSHDGTRVATVEDNLYFGQAVRIWNAEHGQELLTLQNRKGGTLQGMGFGPHDRWFLAQTGKNLRLWDVSPSEEAVNETE